jgi:hypothetical protein
MLVRAVVVADQVNIEVFRDVGFDVPQEGKKLLVPMPLLALGEDAAVGHIKRRKQCRRSVADVVMGDAFDIPQAHRQDRLRALKRLHLALLIDAQNQGILRRIKVEPGTPEPATRRFQLFSV